VLHLLEVLADSHYHLPRVALQSLTSRCILAAPQFNATDTIRTKNKSAIDDLDRTEPRIGRTEYPANGEIAAAEKFYAQAVVCVHTWVIATLNGPTQRQTNEKWQNARTTSLGGGRWLLLYESARGEDCKASRHHMDSNPSRLPSNVLTAVPESRPD